MHKLILQVLFLMQPSGYLSHLVTFPRMLCTSHTQFPHLSGWNTGWFSTSMGLAVKTSTAHKALKKKLILYLIMFLVILHKIMVGIFLLLEKGWCCWVGCEQGDIRWQYLPFGGKTCLGLVNFIGSVWFSYIYRINFWNWVQLLGMGISKATCLAGNQWGVWIWCPVL